MRRWLFLVAMASVGCDNSSTVQVSAFGTDAGDASFTPLDSGADSEMASLDAGEASVETGADASFDATSTPDSGDSAAPEAGAVQAFVRLADWAPDAPASGYDVCLTKVGRSTPGGGILASAGVTAPAFPAVTRYVAVAPGAYHAVLVAAHSTNCANSVLPPTELPDFVAGEHVTIAVVGDAMVTNDDASLAVSFFVDETVSSQPNQATLRFINAVPSLAAVDMGTGNGMTFSPWFTYVAFGTSAAMEVDGGIADVRGYVTLAPVTAALLGARISGTRMADVGTASNVTLAASSVTTLVLRERKGRWPCSGSFSHATTKWRR